MFIIFLSQHGFDSAPLLMFLSHSSSFSLFFFQMFLEYGFHPRVQRWVIGQCLCFDNRSLASYGVRQHGDTAFLYLLSARHARLTPQALQQDQESILLFSPSSQSSPNPPLPATSANGPSSQDWRPYTTLPSRLRTNTNTGKMWSLHSGLCEI